MDDSVDQGVPPRPRKTLKRVAWGAVVALGAGLLVTIGVPLSSALFPDEETVACTVTERPITARGRRGGNIFPRVFSDCGTFRSTKQVACTADPAIDTPLVAGFTYDFTVRGAHVPALLSREIVSARVSATQLAQPLDQGAPLDTLTDDDRLGEALKYAQDRPENRALDDKLAELDEQFSPESLRAFDYEQPPFTPECDISRHVMTSKGLQLMRPDRAIEVLTPPAGASPRTPLLPCEVYRCDPQLTP